MNKTSVYIDGFNLYFGCLKNSPYKWLDIYKLCSFLLPKNEICKIKYFTASVSARASDPQQPVRQSMYLRALKTIPNLEIIYGQFKTRKVKMPLINEAHDVSRKSKNNVLVFRSQDSSKANGFDYQHVYPERNGIQFKINDLFEPLPAKNTQSVYIARTDEKGSDVNLATHLLFDAFKNRYDTAVVISNDSDLAESIRLSSSLGKKIGVLNPHRSFPSRKLRSVCDFYKPIRETVLKGSLFSETMEDVNGKFHKPNRW